MNQNIIEANTQNRALLAHQLAWARMPQRGRLNDNEVARPVGMVTDQLDSHADRVRGPQQLHHRLQVHQNVTGRLVRTGGASRCRLFQRWVIAKKSNLITHYQLHKPSNWCITNFHFFLQSNCNYQLPIFNYFL